MITPKPYEQKIEDGYLIRYFSYDIDTDKLVWHRDKKDRIVEILQSDGWMFQLDNQLPIEMKTGDIIEIPKEIYHRAIKGNGDLLIKIKEL